ncbi:MAG: SDR family NAD(P)-dependent oxidoreductase [Spirochaetales bacterium]
MKLDLTGKLVIVTGASSGLGRDVARLLVSEEQCRVIVVARRADRLEALASEINGAGPTVAYSLAADLTEPDAAERVIADSQRIAQDAGVPLYGLVNNAGVTHYGPVLGMASGEAERILRLNALAPIELARLFVSAVTSTSQHGRKASRGPARAAILNITSLGAHVPVPYQAVYAASKHGLQAFSESLSAELRDAGISVTAVGPGGIDTEMIEGSGLSSKFASGSNALASSARIARKAIRAWKRGSVSCVPGLGNKLGMLAGRVLPRRTVAGATERIFRPQ